MDSRRPPRLADRKRQQAIDAERAKTLAVGTTVDLVLDDGTRMRTRTRSKPWQLGHGQWVVLLEGKSGGWMLERVRTDLCEMPPSYAVHGALNVDANGLEVPHG